MSKVIEFHGAESSYYKIYIFDLEIKGAKHDWISMDLIFDFTTNQLNLLEIYKK